MIIRLDGIGDSVLTTPLLPALQSLYPESRITMVVRPAVADVWKANPCVHRIIEVSKPRGSKLLRGFRFLLSTEAQFRKLLRQHRFDLAISPRWDVDTDLTTYLVARCRSGTKVGYEVNTSLQRRAINGGYDRAFTIAMFSGVPRHEVLRNLEVVPSLGGTYNSTAVSMPLTRKDQEAASTWLSVLGLAGSRLAVFGMPAAHAVRRWDPKRFKELAAHLLIDGFSVVLVTDSVTKSLADEIAKMTSEGQTIAVANQLPLGVVGGLLSDATVFVGNDSGIAHVAAAVGCPVITITPHALHSGQEHRSSPFRFSPWSNQARVIGPMRQRPGCEGGCESMKAHCIDDVTVPMVLDELHHLLTNS